MKIFNVKYFVFENMKCFDIDLNNFANVKSGCFGIEKNCKGAKSHEQS